MFKRLSLNEDQCKKKKNGTYAIRQEMFDFILVIFSEIYLTDNISLRKKLAKTHIAKGVGHSYSEKSVW